MKLLRHAVAGLVIFALFITLFVGIFTPMEDNYPLTISGEKNGQNIVEILQNISIISGMEELNTAIFKASPSTGNSIDILGALASAAVGILLLVGGVLTFPVEILAIIFIQGENGGFYYIPPIIPITLTILITIYVGFILISAHLGKDV